MDDLQRAVGRLEGKLDAALDDIKAIKADVEIIKRYRWQLAGGATVVSVIAAVLTRFLDV